MKNTSYSFAVFSMFFIACTTMFPGSSQQAKNDITPPERTLTLIDSVTIRNHLAFLSDDRTEGRAPGSRGEQIAVTYIAEEMRKAGLEPAGEDGTFFQEVPLRIAAPRPQGPLVFRGEGGGRIALQYMEDFIAGSDLEQQRITTRGELVFAGFGVNAPDYDWNDFEGVDVEGKILVVFVNDPPAPEYEPNLFRGDTLTYYGRWTYKYEEARRQGAKGVLLIHTDETAGYPFSVLQNSSGRAEIQLQDVPENALEFRGWITRSAAERLAEMTGSTLETWYDEASKRGFRPRPLSVEMSYDVIYQTGTVRGINVLGKISGRERPDEAIVYTAHHDHLGVGVPDSTGDAIYNGALDNASGVAMMLAVARAFGEVPPVERSVVFASVTAEESGLLGAEYYVRYPSVPISGTIANINLDSGNIFGRAKDIIGNGAERSDILAHFVESASAEGMTVTPNSNPGGFYRSDQLAFARQGVPAVYINTGRSFVGQPDGYWNEMQQRAGRNYHQPGDEFDPSWPMGGLVQQARVAFRLGYRLANSDVVLKWNPGEAFANAR